MKHAASFPPQSAVGSSGVSWFTRFLSGFLHTGIMAYDGALALLVDPNERPLCKTLGCLRQSRPNCSVPGYCSWGCYFEQLTTAEQKEYENLGPNGRPLCLTPGCPKESKPKCAANGYCSWGCYTSSQLPADAVVLSADGLPPCALLACEAYIKKKRPYYRPFCSNRCSDLFDQLLVRLQLDSPPELVCPLCQWSHYTGEGYSSGAWMLFHLQTYHDGSCYEEFVKNVQLAMKELYKPDKRTCRDHAVNIRSADSASASSVCSSDWIPIDPAPGLTPPPPPPYNNPNLVLHLRGDLFEAPKAPREVS